MEYQKIEGEGNQGQFVHANQDMASKQGFGNVSKLWYDKTMSYDQGMEMLESCLLYTSPSPRDQA